MNEDQQTFTLVGKLTAYKVLFCETEHNGWDVFSIFEIDQAILDIGELIYNFANEGWKKNVRRHYKDDFLIIMC
jgi:hypothetical protein